MSGSKDAPEPSMEEILSSIRRIIADEDKEEQSETAAEAAEADLGLDEPEDDVLELTQVVGEDGGVVELDDGDARAPEGEPAAAADTTAEPVPSSLAANGADHGPKPGRQEPPPEADPAAGRADADETEELELQPIEADTPPADPQPQPPVEEAERPVENRDSKPDSLMSDSAAGTSTQAFANLAKEVAPKESEPLPGSSQTVEQLVAEMMRPMLKEWLDANLPALVERVVQDEISKLRKRAEVG